MHAQDVQSMCMPLIGIVVTSKISHSTISLKVLIFRRQWDTVYSTPSHQYFSKHLILPVANVNRVEKISAEVLTPRTPHPFSITKTNVLSIPLRPSGLCVRSKCRFTGLWFGMRRALVGQSVGLLLDVSCSTSLWFGAAAGAGCAGCPEVWML